MSQYLGLIKNTCLRCWVAVFADHFKVKQVFISARFVADKTYCQIEI